MFNAKITGTGMYVPKNLVTNADIEAITGKSLEKFAERIGIKQRYVTGPDESTADMATYAGQNAIANAGLKAEDIDLVVVATDTPEYVTPPTAIVVQGRLQAVNAGAFDINGACSGFVAAYDVVSRMVMSGGYKNALLIGVYNMTKFADKTDAIFADGAGAVVISQTEEDAGFMASYLYADGTQYDFLGIYGGGAKYPIQKPENVDQLYNNTLTSLKPLPGDRNVKLWPVVVKTLLDKKGLEYKDIDFVIFTQINKSVILQVMDILGLPVEKTICVMDKYGYTGSGCIPIALHSAVEEGKIKKGDNVVLVASGAGLAVASALMKW
ncbi:MAG: ketoacyl-ACP synthase III [Clostridia bacterium]|nr:ketoacyl-ACP synthase III [Clostridia bacterium]